MRHSRGAQQYDVPKATREEGEGVEEERSRGGEGEITLDAQDEREGRRAEAGRSGLKRKEERERR